MGLAESEAALAAGASGASGESAESAESGESGAVVVFDGVVRAIETGRPLRALRYQAYEPMTTRELRSLAEAVAAEHRLHALRVWHSVGEVAVGRCSFRLQALGAHRAETLAATGDFIEKMKKVVPLWKVPVFR